MTNDYYTQFEKITDAIYDLQRSLTLIPERQFWEEAKEVVDYHLEYINNPPPQSDGIQQIDIDQTGIPKTEEERIALENYMDLVDMADYA